MYEIVMPQLSDSMDEGKLIAWKVGVGQSIKSGDVIAEVESDKAIMEVQSFKEGIVKELLVKEGEEVKVGTVIARVETKTNTKEHVQQERVQDENVLDNIFHVDTQVETQKKKPLNKEHLKLPSGKMISPKARAKAAAYGLDIADMKKDVDILHADDVENYLHERYFTPKALALLRSYHLESSIFTLDHKIDEVEVQEYIVKHQTPLPKALSAMQKAIISNVKASAQKPTFHIYESADASLLQKHKERSITVWIIKIIAKVMMQHEAFRSRLLEESVVVFPNASLSIAVADEKDLYMPVIADANTLSQEALKTQLEKFKTKLQNRSFTQEDMQGSTFELSNLGMLGVERFDAMINKDDAAIMAVGAVNNGKISLTLTADHRLINGYEAALFMRDVKKELQNALNFKE